ncbi:hypothetical protein FPQ18DRAFT_308523 [Pyronema domesticum]|nr:hypothetical protein FPQ18DRAFT_308523 [Pyronema domesticum]
MGFFEDIMRGFRTTATPADASHRANSSRRRSSVEPNHASLQDSTNSSDHEEDHRRRRSSNHHGGGTSSSRRRQREEPIIAREDYQNHGPANYHGDQASSSRRTHRPDFVTARDDHVRHGSSTRHCRSKSSRRDRRDDHAAVEQRTQSDRRTEYDEILHAQGRQRQSRESASTNQPPSPNLSDGLYPGNPPYAVNNPVRRNDPYTLQPSPEPRYGDNRGLNAQPLIPTHGTHRGGANMQYFGNLVQDVSSNMANTVAEDIPLSFQRSFSLRCMVEALQAIAFRCEAEYPIDKEAFLTKWEQMTQNFHQSPEDLILDLDLQDLGLSFDITEVFGLASTEESQLQYVVSLCNEAIIMKSKDDRDTFCQEVRRHAEALIRMADEKMEEERRTRTEEKRTKTEERRAEKETAGVRLRRADDPVDWGCEVEQRAYSVSVALEDEERDRERREKCKEVLAREARIHDGYRTNQERWEWEEDHDVERQGAVPNRIWRELRQEFVQRRAE